MFHEDTLQPVQYDECNELLFNSFNAYSSNAQGTRRICYMHMWMQSKAYLIYPAFYFWMPCKIILCIFSVKWCVLLGRVIFHLSFFFLRVCIGRSSIAITVEKCFGIRMDFTGSIQQMENLCCKRVSCTLNIKKCYKTYTIHNWLPTKLFFLLAFFILLIVSLPFFIYSTWHCILRSGVHVLLVLFMF